MFQNPGSLAGIARSALNSATSILLSPLMDAQFGSTRGSILYRDAAAWKALGPGTSGQQLQSGGPGANPSWVTPAAPLTPLGNLLNTVTASGSGNTLADTTSITSSYKAYEVVVNAQAVANPTTFSLQVHASGAYQTSGYLGSYTTFGQSTITPAGMPTNQLQLTQTNTVAAQGIQTTFRIYSVSGYPQLFGHTVHPNGVIFLPVVWGGGWNSNTAMDGFAIFPASGNLIAGSWMKVYGLN